MKVVYSEQAKEAIKEYRKALKQPPYNKRPMEAYRMALAFKRRLKELGNFCGENGALPFTLSGQIRSL